ncbi:MAG TPA: 4-(cytidine 5'-diphospho)-2-C-methyl-D-erythritol kinase [Pyrinomonadaceae bacterium]|nr:4-(cytidine 5'-diphospho)-2-C-methyl-D-erythritol kinase [Pyrinomonadaceae bacterium]
MTQSFLSLPSFAKINWSLQVRSKRADGYHEVRTILQTISLCDSLQFEATGDGEISLVCDDPAIPTDHQNLVVQAAAALKKSFSVSAGVRVSLEKRIPSKAGLGGASSNAAITLLALTHLWKLPVSTAALSKIASNLGADVSFFLLGGCALATGTGASVSSRSEHSSDQTHLIVITPNVGVSTAEAYLALNSAALTTNATDPILSSFRNEAHNVDSRPWSPLDSLRNDFESVIFDIEPEIGRAKKSLIQAGAVGALLAGSGSSVFGIFAAQEDQQRAISKLKLETGWRVFPCVTLSRNEYLRALSALDVSFLRSFYPGS